MDAERNRTHILVLNYNGRDLLAECLPTLVEATRTAGAPCALSVIDNTSTDDSVAYLRSSWPGVGILAQPNRGLASFNHVLAHLDEDVVLLLNNDVKLAPGAIGPLVAAVRNHSDALFSAPKCWSFDGEEYEGMRTRVRSRFGLVQGLCRVPGHEALVDQPGLTASSGPILAVDRAKFLALGGYDPLYFPGRIEDLDLGFRGWMAGWKGYYVPEAVAYHRGAASFEPAFGRRGCDRLALRNTLLFAWKNLAGRRLWAHLAWLPARLCFALAAGRFAFVAGLIGALRRSGPAWRGRNGLAVGQGDWVERQEAFFQEFGW